MSFLQDIVSRYKFKNIKHFRGVQLIYNCLNYKKLNYLRPLYKDLGLKRSYLSTLSFENLKHLPHEPSWLDKKDSATELLTHPTFKKLSPSYQEELKKWSVQGYVHLKDFFDDSLIDRISELNDNLWNSSKGTWRYGDRKILSAFANKEIWDFLNQEKYTTIVSMLLGHEIILLNNINFLRGDEQPTHSDSFYYSTFPVGRLIGSWIALEDIHEDAAPLCYYPASHKLSYLRNDAINNLGDFWKVGQKDDKVYTEKIKETILENKLSPKFHLPKKGDLFLWHANLLHGGSKLNDSGRTRKSMVAHFVAKDVICYHENSQRPALRGNKPVHMEHDKH
jgi:hypothetical protein